MINEVRFVNYPKHYSILWDEITVCIEDCLKKGDLIVRQQLESFEENLANFVGVDYAIGLNSGTDALLFSLICAGIKPGDEVITVSHTFVATISAIHHLGAKPVLVDIADDMEMDVSKIESVITQNTKAIIPVHLNGRMCNMAKIHELADKYDLIVIEDSAQSLGASFGEYKAGGSGFTGCFSFYPAKILGCAGDGGALVTNDADIAEKVRLLRDHGFERSTDKLLFYGYNSRLDNIQAAILDVKLKYLPAWIEKRRDIAEKYNDGLNDIGDLLLPPSPGSGNKYFDVIQNYVIRTSKRDELRNHLRNSKIETLISWPIPNHKQVDLGLSHFSLPNTERVSNEVLSLPMFPELEDEEIEYVIQSVNSYFDK